MKITISFIIPIVRPFSAQLAIESIHRTMEPMGYDYEIMAELDSLGIGCPKMVRQLVQKSCGDYLCFMGDDTEATEGMIASALAAMDTLPNGWGLVGFNDCIHIEYPATHWIADRRMLGLLDGELFSCQYVHNFCDNELTTRAKHAGRYIWCEDAKIIHKHPVSGTAPADKFHYKGMKTFERDKLMFMKRMATKWRFSLNT